MNEQKLAKKILDETDLRKDGPQALILSSIPLLVVYLILGATLILQSFHVESKTPSLILAMFGGAFLALFLNLTIRLFKICRQYPLVIRLINEDTLNRIAEENGANQNMEPIVTTPVDDVEAQSTQAHV
jgi:hypothetical protein